MSISNFEGRTITVSADLVVVGDVVVDSNYVSVVTEVRKLGPAPKHGLELIFLAGSYNRCRFAHELVTIISPFSQPDKSE